MSDPTTCTCGRPTRDDAYVCDDCGDRLSRALGDIPWLVDELATTVAGQRGVDYRAATGGTGAIKPTERPSPVHWGAADARAHLKATLVTWALFCQAEHVRNSSPYPGLPADNLEALSRWLMWRVDGLTLHQLGHDAVEAIGSAVDQCHRVVDIRPDRWYAGPCNADIDDRECGTDLYAASAAGQVACKACGATYDVAERRKWLLEAAEDRLADATTLAGAVAWLGAMPLNAHRIRVWANRGRIIAKGHVNGRPLYRIGDVIDLLAKEAS